MAKSEIFGRVAVALAGEKSDEELLRYAAGVLGASTASEVHFVHAFPGDGEAPKLEPLSALGAEAPAGFPPHFTHVIEGPREDVLLHFAADRECGLILLGHRAERSGRRSFARRLAMKAPCSVWMAPQGSPSELRRILVPVDLSPRSADVLAQATALAAALGLQSVEALHVYFNESTSERDEAYDERLLEEETDRFWTFAARVELHGVDIQTSFEQSPNVAHAICRLARERAADLIVMGTRGRSRSAAVLLGSETEETIIETRIPVLAVKHFGASLSLLNALLDERFRERSGPRFT